MGHPSAQILSLLLACAFPFVLSAGFYLTLQAKQRETRRVSTAVWKQAQGQPASAPPAPAAQLASYPLTRVLVALVGSALLAAGSAWPSSTLVRSAAIAPPDTGPLLYTASAFLGVILAVMQRLRPLYLVGGIPLLLLLTVGVESTVMLQKYPAYAQQFYGESYGLGWGWILMIAGSGLILFAAILQPTKADFYKPPPTSPATKRDP